MIQSAAATKARAALEAQGLTKRYGRTQALAEIDLAVPPGVVAALIGPNGAGKSTLIKCWLGFERPTMGGTRVQGLDPAGSSSGVLRQIGYLAQGAPLYSDLTVADHLALAGGLRPSFDRPYAQARLRQLDVPLGVRIGRLSGGQQAQVALSLVLATHPAVLLLDEPLASLDPLARREFLDLLAREAADAGQTVLLSSHILSDIAYVCDWLILVSAGRLLIAESVESALASHVVAPLGAGTDRPLIGPLPGGRDAPDYGLYREEAPQHSQERAATLEELVLAYLAAGRTTGRA